MVVEDEPPNDETEDEPNGDVELVAGAGTNGDVEAGPNGEEEVFGSDPKGSDDETTEETIAVGGAPKAGPVVDEPNGD